MNEIRKPVSFQRDNCWVLFWNKKTDTNNESFWKHTKEPTLKLNQVLAPQKSVRKYERDGCPFVPPYSILKRSHIIFIFV